MSIDRLIVIQCILGKVFFPSPQHFFEGVEARVAQGVREEEVSYQLAFNKQELRKVIKEYPGKEVKKGLDNLYKKVDKHLCEEESLLQVSNETLNGAQLVSRVTFLIFSLNTASLFLNIKRFYCIYLSPYLFCLFLINV